MGSISTGRLARLSLGAALACVPAAAWGQDAPPRDSDAKQETTSEEIIVTALKRDISLQQVPTTVSVIGGSALQAANVTSVEQLTTAVPGVRIQNAPAGLVNPTMRGLGSSPSNNSFEQTIGLFADGMFLGHPRDYSAALFDVDRIEILKGTQAAVLGKNTSVGAISLVTKKPKDTFGFEGSYTHEFFQGSDILDGALNVPLGKTLALRVAGQLTRIDGWIDNRLIGRDEPSTKTNAIRATLAWTPTDNLKWTVSGQYSDYKLTGQPFYAAVDQLGRLAATSALYGDPNFLAATNDRTHATGRAGDRGLGIDNDGQRYVSTIELGLGEYTVTALTGYSKYKDFQMVSLTGTVNNPGLRSGNESDHAFSQELRIASPDRGAFSWLAGGYYYNDKWKFDDTFDVIPMAGTPVTGAFRTYYRQKTETISFFGQGTLRPIDRLTIVGGLRYDHANKSGSYRRDILRPGLLTTVLFTPFAPATLRRKEEFVDWSASVQYEIMSRTMLYASYATGSKGGGFQTDPTVLSAAEFKDEHAKTIEVGAKIGFAPGSHLNLAFYNTEVNDYQIAFFTGTSFVVRNDDIRSRGVEAELAWAITDGLSLSGNVTYADAKKTKAVAGAIPGLVFAPKWSGVGKLSYESRERQGLRFIGDAIVEFRSKEALNDAASFVIPSSPGYAKLNLRLGVRNENLGLEVALVGKNLTGKRVVNYAFPAFLQTGGALVATDPPRTVGLQLSIKR